MLTCSHWERCGLEPAVGPISGSGHHMCLHSLSTYHFLALSTLHYQTVLAPPKVLRGPSFIHMRREGLGSLSTP